MRNLNSIEQQAGAPADVDPLGPDVGIAGVRRLKPLPATSATDGRTALAVEVQGVRKSFGDHLVLDGVDLEVMEGTVFALLGPNGSGKTTAVRILSTLLAADAGVVRVAGHDVAQEPDWVRDAIGVTGQFSAVDKLLTGRENLVLMADLAHMSRADGRRRAAELLVRFDLLEAADKAAATYSGGMRRRLDLAMTLVGHPRVIFLDEPTTGLDPRGRHTVWRMVRSLVADDGVTIFLTTQYLDEADELADRLAVLDHGAVVAEGPPEQLKRRIPGGHIGLQFSDPAHLDSAAALLRTARRDDEKLSLQVVSTGAVPSVRSLLVELDQHGIDVESLSIHTPDLDDVFFAVTGHPTTGEDSRP
ncbi:MAG TPA: ATP-binding cassette domain-containing protein [Acidimicrobiales bacterium]|nr:ATP-binding cassette domain-containing protein [Acidimicrobiales bacterium]